MGQLILRQQAINMKHLILSLCLTAASAQRRGRQEALDAYEGDAALDSYAADAANIPGVPGEDYPIYAEVPESGFVCEGQVDGGYYADPEAECQAFHICTADGAGGLAKYSFLCPNGTLFNQNSFICDWWFNFDCSTAEDLYSLNDEIAAEREALAAEGAASDAVDSYEAPAPVAAPATEYYDEYVAPEEGYVADEAYDYETVAPEEGYVADEAYDYESEATEAPLDAYAVPTTESLAYDDYDATEVLNVYGETTTLVPVIEEYLSPAEEARRGRNSGGGRGSRRGGRAGGRRGNRNQRRPSQRLGRRQFRG